MNYINNILIKGDQQKEKWFEMVENEEIRILVDI